MRKNYIKWIAFALTVSMIAGGSVTPVTALEPAGNRSTAQTVDKAGNGSAALTKDMADDKTAVLSERGCYEGRKYLGSFGKCCVKRCRGYCQL